MLRWLKWFSVFFVMAFVNSAAAPANAYVAWFCNGPPAKWDNPVEQFHGDAFLVGNADWFGGFSDGLAHWRANPTYMKFWNTINTSPNLNTNFDNGRTEIWAQANDASDLFEGNNFGALGYFGLNGCSITEGDVVFNTFYNYINAESKADYASYGADTVTIEAVAVHEIGHVAGFDHSCGIYNVMGSSSTHLHANGDQARQYVGEDLVNGLVTIYNEIPVLQASDVSVVHWRHSGCNNPYSLHKRTEILDQNGDELEKVDDTALEPRYIAKAGQKVDARFTFETLGNVSFQNGIEVGFYYSENDRITTLDRRIGGTSVSLTRDQPDTLKLTIDLPSDIPQGDGYLGVIVDENDIINESNEKNNATYIGMRIDGTDDGSGNGDGGDGKTNYRYAAKFVCGEQPSRSDKRLEPGTYSTTVNILNPGDKQIRILKQVAVTYPPDAQEQGQTYEIGKDPISPLRALETNCDDIRERAFNGTFPTPYVEGFVVVTSPASIDVTAVYTGRGLPDAVLSAIQDPGDFNHRPKRPCRHWKRHCGCCGCCDGGGGDPGGDPGSASAASVSVDVEQIRERKIGEIPPPPPPDGDLDKPDLVPVPGRPTHPNSKSAWCRVVGNELLVRVRNQGAGQAQTSATKLTYAFDNLPIIRAAPVLAPAGDPIDQIDVAFPYPGSKCFSTGSDNDCPFRIEVDSGNHNDETNEANNKADGICFKPEG